MVEHVVDAGKVRIVARRGAVVPVRFPSSFGSHHSLMLNGGFAIK